MENNKLCIIFFFFLLKFKIGDNKSSSIVLESQSCLFFFFLLLLLWLSQNRIDFKRERSELNASICVINNTKYSFRMLILILLRFVSSLLYLLPLSSWFFFHFFFRIRIDYIEIYKNGVHVVNVI